MSLGHSAKTLIIGGLLSTVFGLTQSPATATGIQKLADFSIVTSGFLPASNLTLGTDNLLYGTTLYGTFDGNGGNIFSFNPANGDLTSLAVFNNDTPYGDSPSGSLSLGIDGFFYGTTDGGSDSYPGYVFSFDPTNNALAILANFGSANGSRPQAGLTLGGDGLFYGTTLYGGSFDAGTIFSFNPTDNVLTSLASFNGANGAFPYAAITPGTDGLFYGTTRGGQGGIFSFNPTNNDLKKLATFNGVNGATPEASLTLGADGLFYGTTRNGGSSGTGTIFSFNPANNVLTSLISFDGSNGRESVASLTLGGDGLLYGTSVYGGSLDKGTMFSFNPIDNVLTTLANFDGTNGAIPLASLTLAADGLFYGTTSAGGNFNNGTIYSFDPGQPVPEPLTLLGASTAVAFGAAFKRRKIQG